ncbi:MAG: PASTA domain-containing protein [Eubacteriaceae bacterium]|nr:PASTA domain-containing protein [Eubacteriaceae bacterium]
MSGESKFFENYQKREILPSANSSQQPPKAPNNSGMQIDRWLIYSAIATAACLVIFAVVGFSTRVRAEDFSGWLISDVELWAMQSSINIRVESIFSDEVGDGRVISQAVSAKSRIKKGSFIELAVSKGHDLSVMVDLPDFLAMNATTVNEWAAKNYMSKVRLTSEKNSTMPVGAVIRFEINDSSLIDPLKARRDSPIYIIVAARQDVKQTLALENFVGKTAAEFGIFASERGFELKITEVYDENIPAGQVISQQYPAGESIFVGDTVEATVSKGKRILVPDFAGMGKEQAAARAASAGCLIIQKDRYSQKKAGEFVSQSLKAGTEYEKDAVIELSYSLGSTVAIPSFIGQTQADIESWADSLNNEKGAQIAISVATTKSSQAKGAIIHQDKHSVTSSYISSLSIVVSSGNVVFMPQLVSSSHNTYDSVILREEAMRLCEESGLVAVFAAEENPNVLPGEIWQQSVAAGTEVAEGSRINIKYRPANQTHTVPNFIGMSASEARSSAYSAYFLIVIDGDLPSGASIAQQSIRAGSTAAMGSKIVLTLSASGSAPAPPAN